MIISLFILPLALVGIAGCSGGNRVFEGGLDVSPQSVTLTTGQKQEFHSAIAEVTPESISWKVQEGDAGGIIEVVHRQDFHLDELVTYTAPQTTGTYHVQVTAKYNEGGTKTATATVEVK